MASVIHCSSCSRQLRVPEALAGQLVKCPGCGQTFTATLAAPATESSPPPPPPPPAMGTTDSQKPCPYCGELVAPDASQCRICGERLDVPPRAVPPRWEDRGPRGLRRDLDAHRGALVLTFGILSVLIAVIGLPLGIAAWMMGHGDLRKMRNHQMDPSGMGLTQAGWICGIIGTLLQTAICGFCGLFFMFIFASSTSPRPAPRPVPRAPMPGKVVVDPVFLWQADNGLAVR